MIFILLLTTDLPAFASWLQLATDSMDYLVLLLASPNRQTLAVGESLGGNNGKVQLFTKTGSNWVPGNLLISTQTGQTLFGSNLQYSPDGKIISVGEYFADANGKPKQD